jgi:hypothetical protein
MRYRLELEAVEPHYDRDGRRVEPERRLRSLLKIMLRGFGFRCKAIDPDYTNLHTQTEVAENEGS